MARDEAAARAALRKYLDEMGWSVQRLSDEASVDYDTASAIQDPKSTRWPRRHNQLKIERALGLPDGMIERAALGEPLPAPRIPSAPTPAVDAPAAPDGAAPLTFRVLKDDGRIVIGVGVEDAARYTDEQLEAIAVEAAGAALLAANRTKRDLPPAR